VASLFRSGAKKEDLFGLPGRHFFSDISHKILSGDPLLGHAIAFTNGDSLIGKSVIVYGHAERGTDLILPSIALSDRSTFVIGGAEVLLQICIHLVGQLHEFRLLHERKHGYFVGRKIWVKLQHRTLALEAVSVAQGRKKRPITTHRGLDHVGKVLFLGCFIKIFALLAREFLVAFQVEVRAVVDSLDFLPADRKLILDIESRARIVGKLTRPVLMEAKL
jgi:hypothetical protein